MDEAFSALDPLIRTEMQDELLSLGATNSAPSCLFPMTSTRPCVSATVSPLCRAALWCRSAPDEILNNPANDYVRTFFRGVDISHVFSAKDIARRRADALLHVAPGFGPRSALKVLNDDDREYGYLIERGQKFAGIVSVASLEAY